ncbi:DUF1257 domain-containing protein [Actinoplanes sp. NPDC051470]|uniref:DUF1257 domain-containing protein n=1 Tax=Actinoplanes sp. NPDC051470 TaxID=3157224 RepID=UPI003430394C
MSHYTTLTTRITDTEALCGALADVGYDDLEVYDQPQRLVGFQGDPRGDRAHVIIRRKHVGLASNDIGFLRQDSGTFLALISEYDLGKHNEAWLGQVTARHAYRVTSKTLATQGFDLVDEQTERDGTVRMVLRRTQY